ncbi:MAG: transcriptional regulator [Candidatus Omnitrophica bacterium]|nr:transcriptional regulator [Candidatus Omnitrophota bacterium]
MINRSKKRSKVLDMVEEELYAIGELKDASLSIRNFNKIRYPEPKKYTAKNIIKIRKKLKISQSVFAYLMNASESTIRQWESGAKVPGGANCRLLQIIENNGVDVFLSK